MASAHAERSATLMAGHAAPRTEVDQLWERILGPRDPADAASSSDDLPRGATYSSLPQVTLGVAAPRQPAPALAQPHPLPLPAAAPALAQPSSPSTAAAAAAAAAASPARLLAAHLEAARDALLAQPPSTLPVISPSREARDLLGRLALQAEAAAASSPPPLAQAQPSPAVARALAAQPPAAAAPPQPLPAPAAAPAPPLLPLPPLDGSTTIASWEAWLGAREGARAAPQAEG